MYSHAVKSFLLLPENKGGDVLICHPDSPEVWRRGLLLQHSGVASSAEDEWWDLPDYPGVCITENNIEPHRK